MLMQEQTVSHVSPRQTLIVTADNPVFGGGKTSKGSVAQNLNERLSQGE